MIAKGEISMKKINLNEYVKNSSFIKPVNEKDINGGCTLVLGCNSHGYYTDYYTYTCSKVTKHTRAALAYANNYCLGRGKYQVTGESDVIYLGR